MIDRRRLLRPANATLDAPWLPQVLGLLLLLLAVGVAVSAAGVDRCSSPPSEPPQSAQDTGAAHSCSHDRSSTDPASILDAPAHMLDRGMVFTGVESDPMRNEAIEEVRIGLFVGSSDPVSDAIRRGARLAIGRANTAGGIDGVPLQLVHCPADDPWGTGGRQLARLVVTDRLRLVIGGHDGTSSHVAQQITTKMHLPLIVPVASDPSLTHTRVPWIFRLAPDDQVQAATLVTAGLEPRGLRRPALVTSTDHDDRVAGAELVKALEEAGTPAIAHLTVDPRSLDPDRLAVRLAGFDPDAVVLRLPPGAAYDLLSALGAHGPHVAVLLPWIPGLRPGEASARLRAASGEAGELIMLEPFRRPARCGHYLKLVHHFTRAFGEYPPPAAAYGYDAANLAIAALRRGGLDRSAVRKHLAAASGAPLASGVLSWDNGGGNRGRTEVVIASAPEHPALSNPGE